MPPAAKTKRQKPKQKKRFFGRTKIPIETKLMILEKLKTRDLTDVANELNMKRTSVRSIQINEHKVRAAAAGFPIAAKRTPKSSTPCLLSQMSAMEAKLVAWCRDLVARGEPLLEKSIRSEAIAIFNKTDRMSFNEKLASPFLANRSWFQRFMRNHSQLQLFEDPSGQADSRPNNVIDEFAAEQVNKLALEAIVRGQYTLDQIFNVARFQVNWKVIPSASYMLVQDEEMVATMKRTALEKVEVLICSNASGDFRMNPLLVTNKALYNTAMSLSSLRVSTLLFTWKTDPVSLAMPPLFKEWFHNDFVRNARNYLQMKKRRFKVLLLLNEGLGYAVDLRHPNVTTLYMPRNTALVTQPLYRIISAIRGTYTKRTAEIFTNRIKVIQKNHPDWSAHLSIVYAYSNFTILDCCDILSSIIRSIKPTFHVSCWRNVLAAIYSDDDIDESQHSNSQDQEASNGQPVTEDIELIVLDSEQDYVYEEPAEDEQDCLAEEEYHDVKPVLNGSEIKPKIEVVEVPELNDTETTPPHTSTSASVARGSDEDYVVDESSESEKANENSAKASEDSDDGTAEEQPLTFNIEDVRRGLKLAKDLEDFFVKRDPSVVRKNDFQTDLKFCLAPYAELLQSLEKQQALEQSSSSEEELSPSRRKSKRFRRSRKN